MKKTIVGLFHEAERVKRAIDMLEADGYSPQNLTIILQENDTIRSQYMVKAERLVTGAAFGAVIGGIAGVFVSFATPYFSLFIQSVFGLTGPVFIAVISILAGSIIGILVAAWFRGKESMYYENAINEGALLLAVPPRAGDNSKIVSIFRSVGAFDVKIFSMNIDELIKKYDIESALDSSAFSLQYMYLQPIGTKGGKTKKPVKNLRMSRS